MSGGPLPHRPRLLEHGLLRRHVVDGQEKLLLHDGQSEQVLELTLEQLSHIIACDGTRDIGGVMLAAARAGAYRRASSIEQLLAELHERGLLGDGVAPLRADQPSTARSSQQAERPLEPLPGYRFACDGNSTCCATYSSVPFSLQDARRAQRLAPEVVGEGVAARFFLPLHGSVDDSRCAVTMVDGACAFLTGDGRCRMHAAEGAEAKPRGCQTFPACHVDDGEAIRVSVAVECACVLTSLDSAGAEPLVAASVRTAGELPPGTRIATLPATVRVNDQLDAPRAALRRWSVRALEAVQGCDDAVAAWWALADAANEGGIDGPIRPLAGQQPPSASALGFQLMALAAATADKRETTVGWRSVGDRARRLSAWLDIAAQALLDPKVAAARLEGAARHGLSEAFHLRALLWGHQLVSPKLTLVQSLRDRAVRVLLARQCAEAVPDDCADDPSAGFPLTAVEAMMRGQGLDAYVVGLG